MFNKIKTATVIALFFWGYISKAQETNPLTIDDAVSLALENHPQLALSQKKIEIAKQNTTIGKLQKLPSISASTSQFYLGNSVVLDKDLGHVTTVHLPHYGSSYGVQASQLIFKGGAINKSLEIAALQEQLSQLDLEKDQQDVKFLVTSNYLDIYKIINQREVYLNNKVLAEQRLNNVKKFYQQGMITRNEVIRGELAIMNIAQGILVLDNNRKILNYNLNNALGLTSNIQILPTENIQQEHALHDLNYFLEMAQKNSPRQRYFERTIEIAEKNIEVINSDKMPTVAAFGGYTLNRPVTSAQPVADLYSGGFQVGVSVNYNIDNLYKTKERLALGRLQKEQAQETYNVVLQNLKMEVNAAFTKHQNAAENMALVREAKILAEENYKITEAKYLNQLAVQAEMTDAQNQKIQAELDLVNAQIDQLYQYYNLLKVTGTL